MSNRFFQRTKRSLVDTEVDHVNCVCHLLYHVKSSATIEAVYQFDAESCCFERFDYWTISVADAPDFDASGAIYQLIVEDHFVFTYYATNHLNHLFSFLYHNHSITPNDTRVNRVGT